MGTDSRAQAPDLPVALWALPATGSGPLSPVPQLALGPFQGQVYLPPAALYTKGGAHGVPFYSCCLGVQGPTPASILEGGTPLGATHGTKPLPPLVGPVLACRGLMRTEEGWGVPSTPFPHLLGWRWR